VYLEIWLEFLKQLLKSFITLQFYVPELYAVSSDTLCLSSTPIETIVFKSHEFGDYVKSFP
jgi:hypothetical protein